MVSTILANFSIADDFKKGEHGAEAEPLFPLTLLTSAQMFGCGKSVLGKRFLYEINRPEFAHLTSKNTANEQTLLSLEYVPILLSYSNGCLSPRHSLRILLLESLLSICPPEMRDVMIREFESQQVGAWDCVKIVQRFSELLGKKFFLHVDGSVRQQAPLKFWRSFWVELYKVQYEKHVLFFTSRNPAPYLISKGHFQELGVQPPSNHPAICLLLDTLKVDHVDSILANVLPDATQRRKAATILVRECGGVGRLVFHACQFFAKGLFSLCSFSCRCPHYSIKVCI